MRMGEYCENCGTNLSYLQRTDAKYCSDACRQAAYRKRKADSVTLAGKRNRGMIKERRP